MTAWQYLQQGDVSPFRGVSIDSRGDQLWIPALHIFHPTVYLQRNGISVTTIMAFIVVFDQRLFVIDEDLSADQKGS